MGNFEVKDPPVFTAEIRKWDRETDADGDAMGKDMEKLFNNTVYNRKRAERAEHVTKVTLTAAGWAGAAPPYDQTVDVPGAAADMEAVLVNAMEPGTGLEEQKAYIKAFGIISSGTAELKEGAATFRVYKKTATDCIVGLKGV